MCVRAQEGQEKRTQDTCMFLYKHGAAEGRRTLVNVFLCVCGQRNPGKEGTENVSEVK